MKYKITEPGWETFTGLLGAEEFVDGVSVDDLARNEAARLGCILRIESVSDNPINPSPSAELNRTYSVQAANVRLETQEELEGVVKAVVPVAGRIYTREELERIADSNGIKGLRAIADELGLKGTSIADLIAKVLEAQAPAPAEAPTPVEPPAPAPAADAPAPEGMAAPDVALDMPADPQV
jgi:hypothetical protein